MIPSLHDFLDRVDAPLNPKRVKQQHHKEYIVVWSMCITFIVSIFAIGWFADTPSSHQVLSATAFAIFTGGAVVLSGVVALCVGLTIAYLIRF